MPCPETLISPPFLRNIAALADLVGRMQALSSQTAVTFEVRQIERSGPEVYIIAKVPADAARHLRVGIPSSWSA